MSNYSFKMDFSTQLHSFCWVNPHTAHPLPSKNTTVHIFICICEITGVDK